MNRAEVYQRAAARLHRREQAQAASKRAASRPPASIWLLLTATMHGEPPCSDRAAFFTLLHNRPPLHKLFADARGELRGLYRADDGTGNIYLRCTPAQAQALYHAASRWRGGAISIHYQIYRLAQAARWQLDVYPQ